VEVLGFQHRPCLTLDGTVILFDQIVQLLGLAQFDGHTAVSDQAEHRAVSSLKRDTPDEIQGQL